LNTQRRDPKARILNFRETLRTPTKQTINQPTNKQTNQTTKQPNNQTTNKPNKQTNKTNQKTKEKTNKPTNQLYNQPSSQPIKLLVQSPDPVEIHLTSSCYVSLVRVMLLRLVNIRF